MAWIGLERGVCEPFRKLSGFLLEASIIKYINNILCKWDKSFISNLSQFALFSLSKFKFFVSVYRNFIGISGACRRDLKSVSCRESVMSYFAQRGEIIL